FPDMTVLENVMIGRHCRTKSGLIGAILRGASVRKAEQEIVGFSYDLLEQVGLAEFANEFSKNLP
ncbi:MAG: ABC transporter ATP-binding protein, partial [Geopsychrobacter sp.]|nr:ABC transporter ATP-binding protein [Geopsychrobacter sp.]